MSSYISSYNYYSLYISWHHILVMWLLLCVCVSARLSSTWVGWYWKIIETNSQIFESLFPYMTYRQRVSLRKNRALVKVRHNRVTNNISYYYLLLL
jgi:hypothetical protein